MSRSEPKPKIIYKNLQDLIKSNSLHKNTRNIQTQKLKNLIVSQIINQRQQKILPPKKSSKFIHLQTQNTEHHELIQSDQNCMFYNEIDAIYTELQDFFCHSKDHVIKQLKTVMELNDPRKNFIIKQKVEQIKKMSDYIKHISKFFVQGQVPYIKMNTQKCQQLRSKSKNQRNQHSHGNFNDNNDKDFNKIVNLSIKNNKGRANRRAELLNQRKKSIYQLVLQQKQNKIRLATSNSKKIL